MSLPPHKRWVNGVLRRPMWLVAAIPLTMFVVYAIVEASAWG